MMSIIGLGCQVRWQAVEKIGTFVKVNDPIPHHGLTRNRPMRGIDERQDGMFSYISLDARVPMQYCGTAKVDFQLVFTMTAYNLVRLRNLLRPAPV